MKTEAVDASEAPAVKTETVDANAGSTIKTEPADASQVETKPRVEDVTEENLAKIDRQMNYYFGDYNFPRDKFLQQQAQLDDGWVPLEVMLKCSRLKALTESAETVLMALAKSKDQLLEVSEDKKKIRRSRPAPSVNEEAQLATMSRTAYCKGFPLDEKLDVLLEFFATFGDCETVLMRHYREKDSKISKFKGSVFVVFGTEELAKKFLDLESVKYKDTELIKKWQSVYLDEKKKERLEKMSIKRDKPSSDRQDDRDKKEEDIVLATKSTVSIKDIPGDVTREDIKSALSAACDQVRIAFVEFDKGNVEAVVRFMEQDSAETVLKALGEAATVKVCGVDLAVRALTEEEEKPVLEKASKFLNSRRMFNPRGRGGHFKRGGKRRGGRGGGYRGGKRARTD